MDPILEAESIPSTPCPPHLSVARTLTQLGVMVHTFSPSTLKAEEGRSLQVPGQPCLYIELWASYTVRPYLKTNTSAPPQKNTLKPKSKEGNNIKIPLTGGGWVMELAAHTQPSHLLNNLFPGLF